MASNAAEAKSVEPMSIDRPVLNWKHIQGKTCEHRMYLG